jgi:type IV pilus assembly protein PilY1
MTGVAVDVVPTAVIDQRIEVFSPTDITLMAGTTQVAGTGNLSADSMSIQFFPELQLAANTQFTVTIDANVLATGGVVGPYSWSFTTGADNIAPHASAVAPVAGATGVSTTATISVGFDEPVLAVDTTSFTITDGVTPVVGTIAASGATGYVFTPTAPLTAGTTYTVDLSPAIHDAAGNALADFSYTFTTQ